MTNRRGLPVFELLVTVGLLWLLLLVAAPALGSFFARQELHAAMRSVTVGLNVARCQAIRDGRPVRAEVAGGFLRLSRDDGAAWTEIRRFELGGKVDASANARPVFSPLGDVAPLCTIRLRGRKRSCRIVVSMYGRIRVYESG